MWPGSHVSIGTNLSTSHLKTPQRHLKTPQDETMRALLDLSGCLGDSPAFRKDVNVSEDSIAQLDTSIKNLMKIAKSSMDIATDYSNKNIAFAQELTDFAGFSESKEDPEIG